MRVLFPGAMPSTAPATQRQQGFEDFAEVADEGNVDADVLVDLRGIDLDVDFLGVRGVARERCR